MWQVEHTAEVCLKAVFAKGVLRSWQLTQVPVKWFFGTS
jgi:hypothetical protein